VELEFHHPIPLEKLVESEFHYLFGGIGIPPSLELYHP
jgi:hypothetical protein